MGTIFRKRAIEKRQATLDIGIVEQQPFPELSNWLDNKETINTSILPPERKPRKRFKTELFERRSSFLKALKTSTETMAQRTRDSL